MTFPLQFDKPTATRVAGLLERDGRLKDAASVWRAMVVQSPYDRAPREKYAEVTYDAEQIDSQPGGLYKSQFLLRLIGVSFPTQRLSDAYFQNLRQLLSGKPKLARPGSIVLGLGSGRCGSTTLAAAMAKVPGACATHENPPVLFWEPDEQQLQLHVARLRLLVEYFPLVFDAAHAWLNALPRLLAEFPDLRAIGLHRQTESCVESFVVQKGLGPGSTNHWAVPGNRVWRAMPGDPSYPSYAVPADLAADPDAAKRAMITRYVTEYNDALRRIAAAHPKRLLLVPTEELGSEQAYARMSAFAGVELRKPDVDQNVGGTSESDQLKWVF